MSNLENSINFGKFCGKIYYKDDNFQYACNFCERHFREINLLISHIKNNHYAILNVKTELYISQSENELDINSDHYEKENELEFGNDEFFYPETTLNELQDGLNSEEEEYCRELKRKKYDKKNFELLKVFKNLKEAEEFIKKEKLWSKKFRNRTSASEVVYYRCRQVKRKFGEECAAVVKLVIENDKVSLFQSENDHTCTAITNRSFPSESKVKVENSFKNNIDPLTKNNYEDPLNDKLYNESIIAIKNECITDTDFNEKSESESNSSSSDSENLTRRKSKRKCVKKRKAKVKKQESDIEDANQSASRDESKRKYTKKTFKLEKVFENIEDAEKYIKSENSWSKKNRNKVTNGEVIFYRCRRVKRKYNEECAAMVKLVVEPDKVSFHRSEEEHNCSEIMKRNLSCDPKFKKLLEPYKIKNELSSNESGDDSVVNNRQKRLKKLKAEVFNLDSESEENDSKPSTSKRRKFIYTKELEAKLLAEVGSHVLPATVKEEIETLFNQEKKPREIIAALASKDFAANIKEGQIRRFICKLQERRKYLTREALHAEIDEWLGNKELLNVPSDPNQPFIMAHENNSDKTNLILFITTKRLLFNTLNIEVLQMDGNIKLKWQNYLLYPIGTTDANNQFHSIGIVLCEMKKVRDFYNVFKILKRGCLDILHTTVNPNILLCSGMADKCIQLAFKNFFSSPNDGLKTEDGEYEPEIKIRSCYSFLRKQCRRKLDEIIPEQKNRINEVMEDLDFVQKAFNAEEFCSRIENFANRWALYVEFMTYFHQEWFDINGSFQWYEGYTSANVQSNDFLAEQLKLIETDETFRNRLPVNQFSVRIFDWIKIWSVNEFEINFSKLVLSQLGLDEIEKEKEKLNDKVCKFMENQENDLYDSLSDESINTLIKKEYRRRYNFKEEHRQRQKGHREFVQDRVFSSKAEAEALIAAEKMWSFSNRSHTKAGTKLNYRCRVSRRTQTDCSAGVSLFLRSDCTDVILYRTTSDHCCDGIPRKQHGISEVIREEIDRLSELNMKPKAIIQHLEQQQFLPLPTETQVLNYLTLQRERKYGAHNLDFSLLESWLQENYKIPEENFHKMFVVSYEVCNNAEVRFFVSTKKLLQNAINIENIQIDNTHKLGWIKFPFFVIGTTDRWNKFHCLGLCVCNSTEVEDFEFLFKSLKSSVNQIFKSNVHPNILITDNTINLQQAFLNIFGATSKIKICNEHIKRMLKFKSKMIKNKDVRCGLLADLHVARKCANLEAFQISMNQFLEKWPKLAPEFCTFFQQDYISYTSFWYAGFEPNSPKSNVASEVYVKCIKNDESFRKKIPLNQFIITLSKWVENWSHIS